MSTDVGRVFDAMAGSYDTLEPWYEHLYAVLHAILRRELAPGEARRALDVGCGTGYQTAILGELGYETHGVDLSAGLLAVARARLSPASAVFARANAIALPYRPASFDVVTCCGSTLSLVDDPTRVVQEIGRVLRPGGRALIECEHRWSLDLGWTVLSALTRDSLGYGVDRRTLGRQLRRPLRDGIDLDYPLSIAPDVVARVRLHLFTRSELRAMLRAADLVAVRTWGIHALTNLIPSTVLHRERLGRATAALYGALCTADDGLRRAGLAHRLANSLVILAVKQRDRSGQD